ncbi:hypothetical protein PPYR_08297 [Photinus pyralis]|uniref:triacylglycerol lipase n=1 Tax=Photinus pyralis TaxID=7054 RepID=A0A1Y1MLK4_PHOPY|nr:1-acylglycerol-3-phosphate O-acyltransferase Pnpla3-like [Photinus pyralis]KAB0797303.1 hypothetical protein PPYR_08297 [Photinus pyralis]
MNLSFAGCGFLGIYHVGVAVCFRKYAPHLLLNKISGASAGAIAACCLLCDLPLGDITSDVLRVALDARSRSLGPFSPSFKIQTLLLEGLEKYLPEDAHVRVSGKLHISLTRVYDGKNVIVSQFESKEDLLQALLASAFVPIFSGILPPKFRGVRCMDGGFSDNLPAIDENTITVSPFCGESDICPRDDSSQLFHINVANTSIELSRHNIYRMTRILFPPKPEVLSNMCKQGFDDALRFLHRNNLIGCTRCLAVQSTFIVSETIEECLEYDPECSECKLHQEEALVSNMPDTVMTVFQEAIDSANKGLINWLFKHRGMKLLSILSLPYVLPADIMYATFTKLMSSTPRMGNTLWELSKFFMDQLSLLLHKVNVRQQLNAKISCQLAISEYGGNAYNMESVDHEIKNRMNMNFTVNLNETEHTHNRKYKTITAIPMQSNLTVNSSDIGDDTFEQILEITSHHEAIMAFYYMDENNKVKVTEIFDVTDSDTVAVLTPQEIKVNKKLELDDEWNDSAWSATNVFRPHQLHPDEMSEYSVDDNSAIFSDPESEWTGAFKLEEQDDDLLQYPTDARPESDQLDVYCDEVHRKGLVLEV